MQSKEGRLPLKQFNSEDLTQWVHLDSLTGQELWRRSMGSFMAAADNVIYLTRSGSTLVATGSLLNSKASDTEYRIEAISAANGETLWQRSHLEGKPGAYSHGEQNHHPVILKSAGWVIAEPYAYRLEDGEVLTVDPAGQEKWKLVRPGHSCGTITAGAECLFFRANNPTSLDMRTAFQFAEQKRLDPKRVDQAADWEFEKLAPTRPGCWINIIPAGGLALIPEASSGCVCHYSLQTSMAFLPVGQ
jgi:outer membrane protein assembly factor BamB